MKKTLKLALLALMLVIVLLLADAFLPLLFHAHRARSAEEILRLADNEAPAFVLLTKKYKLRGKREHKRFDFWFDLALSFDIPLTDYFRFRGQQGTSCFFLTPLEELDKHMPVQCLRKVDKDRYYAIYQDRKGTLMYAMIMWQDGLEGSPNRENKLIVTDTWLDIPETRLYRRDFERLQVGKSNLEDVRKIVPKANPTSGSGVSILSTGHETFDGYHVRIEYYWKDNSITKIEIKPVSENSVRYWLLPQDRPK